MKQLSEKAVKFCECYIKNGYKARDAYKEAYGQEDDIKASVGAYNLLKDSRVKDELDKQHGSFKTIGYKVGMTKEAMVKTLFAMINAERPGKNGSSPDWTARFNAVMGFARLTGEVGESKKAEVVEPEDEKKDLSKMSPEELLVERKKILEKMVFEKK